MKQAIRLSKNQLRNQKRKAAKEQQKKLQQQEESSISSEGKVMVGSVGMNEPSQKKLEQQLEQMKTQIAKYEEIIYNQGEKIRELINNLEDQNNDLLILRRQLIQNQIETEQQLYEQSQSNFKQEQNMIIENAWTPIQDQQKKLQIIMTLQIKTYLEELKNQRINQFLKLSNLPIVKNADIADLKTIYSEDAINLNNFKE